MNRNPVSEKGMGFFYRSNHMGCLRRNEMKKLLLLAMVLGLLICNVANATEDTPHYNVVNEYITSLCGIYKIQQIATKELQEKSNPSDTLMNGIRNSTRMKLELNRSITAFREMSLRKPFETLLPTTISWYEKKIQLHNEMIEISKTFFAGLADPKPGVDYSKLAATMPEITATFEYIDESIFQMMPLVFALLIDEKPDKEGHMSHLNITKDQRRKFIDTIDAYFGEDLNKQNKNWTVASAALLKSYLLKKGYKCKDEWGKK
jgi:hypothetical protein